MRKKRQLLVEGNDDFHIISSLLAYHSFPQTFEIKDKKGIDKLLSAFPVEAKGSEIEAIAIVIDADLDAQPRWQSVRARLRLLGYSCPNDLPAEGLVLTGEDKPRMGVWIMPDNSLPGMIEDFIALLVPIADPLWAHAIEVLDSMPEGLAEFADVHVSKAKIHTWLAWKDDPGTPMGLAITRRWLDANSPSCTPFLAWLSAMFVQDFA